MASVWVARLQGKHGFEKLVAIKTILPQFASDLRFQKMFLDEAHIASGIEHANVAQILDLGEEHDVLYLVMEFVDGDAISKLQRATDKKGVKIPQGILLRLIADTCAGLHAAHELRDKEGNLLNVVHRDVSPQNILVNSKGIAKVIDFGIAKARDRVAGDTGSGLLKGKIQYMPPEQALGKSVDRRADIWAAGAILYHLLVGRPPFDADNQLATLHLLTSGRPPLPLPATVPAPIAKVVRRAMSFAPDKRYDTAFEMQLAIEAAMVESSLMASATDVANFLKLHLEERNDQRKKAVELALKAARERKRMQQLLQPTSADSSSGVPGLDSEVSRRALSSASMPADLVRAPENSVTVVAKMPKREEPSHPGTDGGMFETSNATLGSAAIETTTGSPSMVPFSASQRRRKMIVGGVVGACALIAMVAIVIAVTGKKPPPDVAPASGGITTSKPIATAAAPSSTEPTTTSTSAAATTPDVPTPSTTTTNKIKPVTPAPTATAPMGKTTFPTATAIATTKKPTPPKKVDDGF